MKLIYLTFNDDTRTLWRRVPDSFDEEKWREDNLANFRLMDVKSIYVEQDGRTSQEELEILRLSLARVAQKLEVQTHELPLLNEDTDVFKLTKQDCGWNRLAAFIIREIENMKLAGDAMASQLELVANDLELVTQGYKGRAWSDVIHALRQQAEFGRKHFPKD